MKQRSRATTGLFFGVSAYLIWGSFPLIITASAFANPLETVVWRVVFGFFFAALLVSITRAWRPIVELAKSPKKLGWIAVAALFIFINWETYVIAVVTGNTIESSLGYFINPLITILFAVLILKEKLRPVQWVALGIGFVAVVVLTLDYGRPPWFAFILAFSFAIYSLAKNKVGNKIPALQSFTLESAIVMPIALIQLAVVASMGPIMLFTGVFEASVLIGFGIMTAIPLILFGAAASRIPLASIGFIAVIVLTLDYGRPPWFAFILAFSFAIYSLAKNKVGNKIPALQSFTLESAIVMPVALIQLAVVASMGPIMLFTGVFEASVLIGFGILTAIPLILFGAAASRIPLASIGFIQYLTPTLQFLTAYFILQEPMPAVRWIGFGLVWVSLAVLTFDALTARRGALPIAEQP